MNLILRTIPDLLVISLIPFETPNNIHVPFPSGVPDLPDPSRTFLMKTPESFPNSETGLSLYESYSPDHYGSPRDIPDPI